MKNKLTFGTAGIRGIMQPGENGINKETVTKVASGYADYINSLGIKDKTIIIGHDTRHGSYEYSEIMAKVIISKGIKAFLYKDNQVAPTPLVSFSVINKKMTGGVMITASHNPKEYNGIKIYDQTGKQILPDQTLKIQKFIEETKVPNIHDIKLKYISNDIINAYLKSLESIEFKKEEKILKVAYSPVQGTATILSDRVFNKFGYKHFNVKEQMIEDPDFKNSVSLNPEDSEAYIPLLKVAKENDCDVAFICDPDADRIGVAIKHNDKYKILNGNEIAALYINFLLQEDKTIEKENSYVATTVPSGHLAQIIAKKNNVKIEKTHVGFKNIASIIERNKNKRLLIGYEESFGAVINEDITRDKDSFQAMIAYGEMINYYKTKNINIIDVLENLYKEYSFTLNKTMALIIDKKEQEKLFDKILNSRKIGGYKIKNIDDYRKGIYGLKTQNLLKIYFKGEGWMAIRPSGTEPKVKVYIESKSKSKSDAEKFLSKIIGF